MEWIIIILVCASIVLSMTLVRKNIQIGNLKKFIYDLEDHAKRQSSQYLIKSVKPPTRLSDTQDSNPEHLILKGWARNWGEAAVMSPYFEILQRTGQFQTQHDYYEYLILCPTFVPHPIYFMCEKPFHFHMDKPAPDLSLTVLSNHDIKTS